MRFEGTQVFKSAMNEAQSIMDGVTPEKLREDGGIKDDTRNKLKSLIARYQQLQGVVVEKSRTDK